MIGTTSELRLLASRGMTREELELKKYIAYELDRSLGHLSVEQIGMLENGHERKEPHEKKEQRKPSSSTPTNA